MEKYYIDFILELILLDILILVDHSMFIENLNNHSTEETFDYKLLENVIRTMGEELLNELDNIHLNALILNTEDLNLINKIFRLSQYSVINEDVNDNYVEKCLKASEEELSIVDEDSIIVFLENVKRRQFIKLLYKSKQFIQENNFLREALRYAPEMIKELSKDSTWKEFDLNDENLWFSKLLNEEDYISSYTVDEDKNTIRLNQYKQTKKKIY